MHLLITLIANIKLNYINVLIMGSLIYLSGCGGGGNEPTGNPISPSPISTSPEGSVLQDQPQFFGHPVYNTLWITNSNPHPDAYHLFEEIPEAVPPAVTRETVASLSQEFLTEIELFQEDALRQANGIYSDISAGIQTSNDPIIQALDVDFARDIERCRTEFSPSRVILSYQGFCNARLAYRVPTGGIIITRLTVFSEERGKTSYQFQLGLAPLTRPSGFIGHGVNYSITASTSDESEGAGILYLIPSGVESHGFTTHFVQDDDRVELSQIALNRAAPAFRAGINNLRAIRTGVFDF